MTTATILDQLAEGRDLSAEEANYAFARLMDGQLTPSQSGAFLLTLRAKGETAEEMHAAVQNALQRACLVDGVEGDYADVVGTGGDGKHSFNCSTATALTLAGMGYRIVKHGNRAASSSSGAGDVLEQLGYPLDLDPAGIRESLASCNFAFAFAPHFHPCFKHVGPIRRELGVRTLFNLLGPLINPSRPSLMMLGVAAPKFVPLVAHTLAVSGSYKRAYVFCGAQGYDELTLFGPATACMVQGDRVEEVTLDPREWGFTTPPSSPDELRVETKEEAAAALRAILTGQGSQAMMDMVAFNVALGIRMFEPGLAERECSQCAREALASGVGMKVVKSWGKVS